MAARKDQLASVWHLNTAFSVFFICGPKSHEQFLLAEMELGFYKGQTTTGFQQEKLTSSRSNGQDCVKCKLVQYYELEFRFVNCNELFYGGSTS